MIFLLGVVDARPQAREFFSSKPSKVLSIKTKNKENILLPRFFEDANDIKVTQNPLTAATLDPKVKVEVVTSISFKEKSTEKQTSVILPKILNSETSLNQKSYDTDKQSINFDKLISGLKTPSDLSWALIVPPKYQFGESVKDSASKDEVVKNGFIVINDTPQQSITDNIHNTISIRSHNIKREKRLANQLTDNNSLAKALIGNSKPDDKVSLPRFVMEEVSILNSEKIPSNFEELLNVKNIDEPKDESITFDSFQSGTPVLFLGTASFLEVPEKALNKALKIGETEDNDKVNENEPQLDGNNFDNKPIQISSSTQSPQTTTTSEIPNITDSSLISTTLKPSSTTKELPATTASIITSTNLPTISRTLELPTKPHINLSIPTFLQPPTIEFYIPTTYKPSSTSEAPIVTTFRPPMTTVSNAPIPTTYKPSLDIADFFNEPLSNNEISANAITEKSRQINAPLIDTNTVTSTNSKSNLKQNRQFPTKLGVKTGSHKMLNLGEFALSLDVLKKKVIEQ